MNELERADKAYEQSLDVPPSPYVWTMEQDYCDECGIYLFDGGINDDNSGLCSTCFENWLNDMEDEDEDFVDFGDSDEDQEEIAAMKREHEIALREGGYYICFPEKEARP